MVLALPVFSPSRLPKTSLLSPLSITLAHPLNPEALDAVAAPFSEDVANAAHFNVVEELVSRESVQAVGKIEAMTNAAVAVDVVDAALAGRTMTSRSATATAPSTFDRIGLSSRKSTSTACPSSISNHLMARILRTMVSFMRTTDHTTSPL
jgi:hypothetical protein